MKPETPKIGRPSKPRDSVDDLNYVKRECISACKTMAKCYSEIYEELKNAKYKEHEPPEDLETIKSAFTKFFSGKRPLRELYWLILEVLFGIRRSDLPSRNLENNEIVRPFVLGDGQTLEKTKQNQSAEISGRRNDVSMPDENQLQIRTSKIPPRENQSLPNWFRGLSLQSIRRMVIAASATSPAKFEINFNELLDSECLVVVAEKLVYSNTENFLEFYSGDFVEMQILTEFRKAIFKLILLDSEFKQELFRRFNQWLCERSSGKVFSNITQFLSVGMRYWFDHSYGDLVHFDKDLEDVCGEFGEVIEATFRNIPYAQFDIRNSDLDIIPCCVAYLIDCEFISAVCALLHLFSESQCAFLKDMMHNPYSFKKELFANFLSQIKSIEKNLYFNDVPIKDWNMILDFLVQNHVLSLNSRKSFTIKSTAS